ncbi:MAG: hypothetical protein AAF495_15925 [Pseudomonadota bacterium]
MEWRRFPVTAFDHRVLKKRPYAQPTPISGEEEARIVEAAAGGDASVAGGYAVTPNGALLEALDFRGAHQDMVLCALPGPGAQLLGRSYAWFNQRAFILDRNASDAETLFNWRTPRPMNTLLGPETGVTLDRAVIYILSGRMLSDHTRGNRVMIDQDWSPGEGRAGFRVITACDEGEDNFHDSCFELSWQT